MRRGFLLSISFVFIFLLCGPVLAVDETLPEMKVYKSASCGCCVKWIEHLEARGFKVEAVDMRSMAEVKRSLGIQSALASCHTGIIGDYVIEGHVPAADILRLLKEKPAIKGLSVPKMPLGSPGMEQEDGRKEPYEVLTFDETGKTAVWAKH